MSIGCLLLRATPSWCPPRAAVVDPLSEREREILGFARRGPSEPFPRRRLFVSENTIKWHLKRIYEKLGVTVEPRPWRWQRSQQLVR